MSEWVSLTSTSTHYMSFWRRVFPVNHLHWYWQPNKNNQETEHTNNITQKESLVNSTTHNHKKPRLRDRTERAWFSRFLRDLARKWSGSILTTPEPARNNNKTADDNHCYINSGNIIVLSASLSLSNVMSAVLPFWLNIADMNYRQQ